MRNIRANLVITLALAASAAQAQPIVQGRTWDEISRLPDWQGTWEATTWRTQLKAEGRGPFEVVAPLNTVAAAKLAQLKAISDAGGDVPTRYYRCIVHGLPGGMDGPMGHIEFSYAPGRVVIDNPEWVRRVYTDGRPHNENVLTFQGDSIGHWQAGGVLATDTIGLDPGNEFILGIAQGKNSRVSERMHRKDRTTFLIDVVLTAPDVLTKPWAHTITYRHGDFPVTEADCAQNNRDFNSQTGGQTFSLTPPP